MNDNDSKNSETSASFSDEKNTINEEVVKFLEEQLETEKDKRLEERFLFILVIVILADIILLQDSENWGLPIAVLVLEMIGLSLLAQKMGIEEVPRIINSIISIINSMISAFRRG